MVFKMSVMFTIIKSRRKARFLIGVVAGVVGLSASLISFISVTWWYHMYNIDFENCIVCNRNPKKLVINAYTCTHTITDLFRLAR